jgi:hypothetical protein
MIEVKRSKVKINVEVFYVILYYSTYNKKLQR